MWLILALLCSAGSWATVLGISCAAGAASGPPLSKLPQWNINAGDAAAWCLVWAFWFGVVLCVVLPDGFVK